MKPSEAAGLGSALCLCVQDRPRSAVDQMGFGEREVGRTRMSVEEQLERMRRNQEASSLRERRREPLSRSASFNRDNPSALQVSRLEPLGPREERWNLLLLPHGNSESAFCTSADPTPG